MTTRSRGAAILGLGAVLALALASAACHSRSYRAPAPTYARPTAAPAPAPAPAATAFDAQASRGQAAFGRYCAQCHGPSGGGTEMAPALVGPGALPETRPGARVRTMPFHSAGDVARFVVASMPPKGPKPPPEDALAILAFALKANGVTRTEAVSMANADGIVLHP